MPVKEIPNKTQLFQIKPLISTLIKLCNIKKFAFCFLFVGFIFINKLTAADSLAVSYLGIEQGLSNNSVRCIYQDHNGFMWFGTNDGLNKYDGYTFTVFKNQIKNPRSISSNFITDMSNSKNGDIWIATLGGGVSRYDCRKECS